MEELKSPLLCPKTVTVRRNPHRKGRPTPSSAVHLPQSLFSPSVSDVIVPSFPLQDLLSIELPSSTSQNPKKESENLKVFLRVRPLTIATKTTAKQGGGLEVKNAWPKNPKTRTAPKKVKKNSEICVAVKDSTITVSPPESLQESKRVKSEVYKGFSHVFSAECSQSDVYEKMVRPLVDDFLKGKSGMLAALGPSGSGKTQTVFGSAREPGMVPLALRRIFSENESGGNRFTGTSYMSMFEICSEKGKSERVFDLLREGSEVYIQQSAIKGLEEVTINDALQAESLIACGMLRRATAATNSNSQSSRSQCIINICCIPRKGDGEFEDESTKALLTIVDLAGAEREKKTGNQGLRMVESNFINNTSMVFCQCLRSLLEYQKNPRKPLQKHFQNSLLTRYLREYLQGKKRMALILTVKPGEDDYLETSNLLKQAAPYTQIKFTSTDGLGNSKCVKRPIQNFSRAEDRKRMKLSVADKSCQISATSTTHGNQPQRQTEGGPVEVFEVMKEEIYGNLKETTVEDEESLCSKVKGGPPMEEDRIELVKRDRQHHIMINFARALWVVLKQYKENLEKAENELCCLRDDLTYEKKRSFDLENQVKDLKSKSSSGDRELAVVNNPNVIATCTGRDSFQGKHKQKHENSCKPDDVDEISGYSLDDEAVDINPCNGATFSIASQIDDKNRCEEAVETAGNVECLQALRDGEKGKGVNTIVEVECLQAVDIYPDNGETVSIAPQIDAKNGCEEAVETAGNVECLQVVRDVEKCDGANTRKLNGKENVAIDGTIVEVEYLQSLDIYPYNRATVSIASQIDAKNGCEEALDTAGNVECLQVLRDGEKGDGGNTRKPTVMENVGVDNTFVEVGGTDCVESASCCVDSESTILDSAASSPLSPAAESGDCSEVKIGQKPDEQCEKELDPSVIVMPGEDGASLTQESRYCTVTDIAHSLPTDNSGKKQKPKRRLQPVSTNLLKDVGNLAVADDIDKPKGIKGDKGLAMETKNKSRGNMSLLRLLRNDLFH